MRKSSRKSASKATRKRFSKRSKPQQRKPRKKAVRTGSRKQNSRVKLRVRAKKTSRSKQPIKLDPRFVEGIDLHNAHQFFKAHEVLEQVWLETKDRSRNFYKGLIQATVSFYHWSKNNPSGAVTLYRSSSKYLKRFSPEWMGVDVDAFLGEYDQLFGWLNQHPMRYDARLVPQIHWKAPCESTSPQPKFRRLTRTK